MELDTLTFKIKRNLELVQTGFQRILRNSKHLVRFALTTGLWRETWQEWSCHYFKIVGRSATKLYSSTTDTSHHAVSCQSHHDEADHFRSAWKIKYMEDLLWQRLCWRDFIWIKEQPSTNRSSSCCLNVPLSANRSTSCHYMSLYAPHSVEANS